MFNKEISAGTNAEQSTNDETRLPSSPTCGNTNVVRSPNSPILKEVVYEIDGECPNEGEVVVNRDKAFIPITHPLSDGKAVRWITCKPNYNNLGERNGSMYGLLED